jgi:hypothetical protein
MTLGIVIMSHPSRRARAELLAEHVEADGIMVDLESVGEWWAAEASWSYGLTLGATHVLVLQDDAIPVDDLRRHVLARIEAQPRSPISLYLGRVKPTRWAADVADAVEEAEMVGASWLSSSHLLHGVGVVLPSAWIRPMLDACEAGILPYDQRIGRYLRRERNAPVFYTWPSLVDHDDEAPSLVTHVDDHRTPTTGRVAYRVGTVDKVTASVVAIETPNGAEV